MTWVSKGSINEEHRNLPIKQVYVWLITIDGQIIIVSKDGANWQFPGGKPETDETIAKTAEREVKEETGLDILKYGSIPKIFGYYVVEDLLTNEKIIQVRLYIRIPTTVDESELTLDYESKLQSETDTIKHIKLTSVRGAIELIAWLEKSGEYKSLVDMDIIK